MAGRLAFNSVLQRSTRTGTWSEQAASTFRIAAEAVEQSRFEDAAELGRYAVQEAEEAHQLYPLFIREARLYLLGAGLPAEELDLEEGRIRRNLREPDGSEFDLETAWLRFTSGIEGFVGACQAARSEEAIGALDQAREDWRAAHDRACDWVYGMVDLCSRKLA